MPPKVDQKTRAIAIDALVKSGLTKQAASDYEKGIVGVCDDTADYTTMVYERIGELRVCKSKQERDVILKDIKGGAKGWDSCMYSEAKQKHVTSILQSNTKIKAIKGMYKCNKKGCGSDEFYMWSEQRRSSDEGMSVVRQCSKCGKRGVES
jgi:DNA-directed RNA polymerase subunit M/transcription elongation factor TFIIS